jgi:hypothetical protein
MADRRVDLEDGEIVRLGVRERKEWIYAFERAPEPQDFADGETQSGS